jgi:hypothetical protein
MMKEFTFQVTLLASIRVKADTEAEAARGADGVGSESRDVG